MKRPRILMLRVYLAAFLLGWGGLVIGTGRVAHAEDCDPTRFSCPDVPYHVDNVAPDGTHYETSVYPPPPPPAPMPLPLDDQGIPSGAGLNDQDEPNPLFFENGGGR